MKLNLNGLVDLRLRLDGVTLSAEQCVVAWPFVQLYHEGRLTKAQMMARVRAALKKANLQLEPDDDEDDR